MPAISINEVSEDALNLVNMMNGILSRVETVYQDHNVPLPARRYWTLGTAVVDSEQVVISFNRMYLGPVGAQMTQPFKGISPRTATVTISIAREVPVVGMNGRPPKPEQIQEAANSSAIDAWVLMQAMRLFDQWEGYGNGMGVIATVEAADTEGGFQIVSMELTLAVP